MAFVLGPGNKGNLFGGQYRNANPDAATQETIDRASKCYEGGSSVNCHHTKDLHPYVEGLLPAATIDLDCPPDFTVRSAVGFRDGVPVKTTLACAMSTLLSTTGSPTGGILLRRVIEAGPDGAVNGMPVRELLWQGTIFMSALRLGERGRTAPRAIFLSSAFFRLISGPLEKLAETTLTRVKPLGLCSQSPYERSLGGVAKAQASGAPLLVSGDCTKYNEGVDATALLKAWDWMGAGPLGHIAAWCLRHKQIYRPDCETPFTDAPGGMLMGMFNVSATALLQLTTSEIHSFSDDFSTQGTKGGIEELFKFMTDTCHNVSSAKTSISSTRLELNSVVYERSGPGGQLVLGRQLCFLGSPQMVGPFIGVRLAADALAQASNLGALTVTECEVLLAVRLHSTVERYGGIMPCPRPSWFPTAWGGTFDLSWKSLVERHVPDGLLCMCPGGPSPPDMAMNKIDAKAATRRAAKRMGMSMPSKDFPPYTGSTTLFTRAQLECLPDKDDGDRLTKKRRTMTVLLGDLRDTPE